MNIELKSLLEQVLSTKKVSIEKISGDGINGKFKLVSNGRAYFLKVNGLRQGLDMFEKEASGLAHLSAAGGIFTPNILKVGTMEGISFILMDYIISKPPSQAEMKHLGRQLRNLHESKFEYFGLDYDNYIGNLVQKNAIAENWSTFFIHQRLNPQLDLAYTQGLLHREDCPDINYMDQRLSDLLTTLKPSLLHGDLWSGNYLIAENGAPYLIDPAIYFGHCEVDIAMSLLFGGFGKSFYEGYYANIGMHSNSQERIEIYQLYYLLVHLNMFGNSYLSSVMNVINKYFK